MTRAAAEEALRRLGAPRYTLADASCVRDWGADLGGRVVRVSLLTSEQRLAAEQGRLILRGCPPSRGRTGSSLRRVVRRDSQRGDLYVARVLDAATEADVVAQLDILLDPA